MGNLQFLEKFMFLNCAMFNILKSQFSVVTGRDSGKSCSIVLSYKLGKLSRFDNIEKFMSMGAN